MYAFKLVGWESVSINTQYLSVNWFCGSILIGDHKGLKANIDRCLALLFMVYDRLDNALLSNGAMTSHTSWHASPAFWTNPDFSGKEHFSQQSTWDSKCVILSFCIASARLSMHALKTWTGSWTFPLAGLKSCISIYAFVKRQHGWRSPHFIIDVMW